MLSGRFRLNADVPELRLALLALAILGLVTACSKQPWAPVSDEGRAARHPESEYRVVIAGDTLYGIAWEAGRDYRDVARWNGIEAPYVLRPGQRIRLFPPKPAKKGPSRAKIRVVVAGDTLYSIAAEVGVSYRDLAAWNSLSPPYVIKPGQTLRLTPPSQTKTASRPQPSTSAASLPKKKRASKPKKKTGFGSWAWPADGVILARYSSTGRNRGLDIGGRQGQPIRAAASGSVVYKGGGLRGYGQLIILKHDRNYLSAYAHCNQIYVKEGDVIKRGQRIAAMGDSGTDRVKLHFEIRHRGSPVDPLKYLPKR
ncbi:MAG: peptidoglycan DD-metalloendopeptidase family protein [Acidiferrobacterales bacterium]